MRSTTHLRSFLLAAGSSLLAISQLHALDGTWNGVTGNWTDAPTWSGGTLADGTGFTANFTGVDIAADQIITLNGNRTIGNITFTDDTTSSNNLTITGNTLTLDRTSGVPSIDVTQAARTLTISSIIAGNDGLHKNGAGTLRLTNANTFTGGLIINAGTVFVNPATGVNPFSSGTVTIGDVANTTAAAELLYIGTNGSNSFNNAINVRGNGTATVRVLGFNPTFSGAVNLANNLTVISNNSSGSTIGLSGGVTGTGNLVIQSNAANGTNNSAITISGSSVNMVGTITNSGTTTSTTASHTTISALIGTNVTGITQNSANSQLLLSGNNTFTGNIAISAGTLNASLTQGGNNPTSGALGNPSTAGRQVTIASGAVLNFNNVDVLGQGGTSNTALTLIANGGTIRNNVNGINTLGPVQLNGGTLTSNATGTNGFRLTGTVTVGGSAVSTISAASGIIGSGGVITYDVADAVVGSGSDLNVTAVVGGIFGAGGITKTGVGTMTLTAQNTYTGLTRVDNGILTLGHATNTIADTGAVNVNGGTLALGTNTDTVGAVTLTSGSITGTGAGTLTGTGSAYDVRSGTISAKIGGSVGLNKTTGGTVTISSDNSSGGYTGATSVSAGVLAVNGALANTTTTISGTGTLQGSGSIAGAVSISSGGALAPGNSIESLGVGALSFATGSTYAYEFQTNLVGGSPNTSADLTFSSGTLDIASGSFLTLADLSTSTALTLGTKLTLISYFGGWTSDELFTYNAATLADGGTFTLGANTWEFNYNDSIDGINYTGNYGSSTHFVTMTVIPEPNVAALLGGLGALALLRRRRN